MKNCDLGINKYSRPRSKLFAPNRQVTFFFFFFTVGCFFYFVYRTHTYTIVLATYTIYSNKTIICTTHNTYITIQSH